MLPLKCYTSLKVITKIKNMKILFFEAGEDFKNFLQGRLEAHNTYFYDESVQDAQLEEEDLDAEAISVFIYSKVSKEVLDKFPNLKFIATRSTGFDHIDIEECKRRGIKVANVPTYGENTVAEHTFALILSLSRYVHKSYLRSKRNDFSIDGLQGFDLRGKTMGVIGVGRIGKHIIKIAKGFGMNVIAHDRYRDEILAEVLNFKYTNQLDEIFSNSDIVSLSAPLNDETFHIVNREAFSKMKSSAILINTSRGALVDTEALYEALSEGKIAGAGLDVIEGEESIQEERELLSSERNTEKLREVFRDKAIFEMENVVFTPHNAFNSKEAIERIYSTTIENIEGYGTEGERNII